ncbi:MAG: hypothetical protein ABIQ44_10640 [Chloroflexia bacterium]
MEEFKKLTKGLGLVGGCLGGIIILPFFLVFLLVRALWRGLYNMTHPNSQIPNPESPFKKPQPSQSQTEPPKEEKQDVGLHG